MEGRSIVRSRVLERAFATSPIERYAELGSRLRTSYAVMMRCFTILFASERIFCKQNRSWLLSAPAIGRDVLCGSNLGTLVLPLAGMLVLDLLNRSTQRAPQSQEFPQNVCRGNQAHAGANYGWQTAR